MAYVSTIDWDHNLSFQPEKVFDLFREQVVTRVDSLVEETCSSRRVESTPANVVPLKKLA